MTRYLTPSTIAVLVLTTVYADADSVVPSAAVIPVLSFLASHVLPADSSSSASSAASSSGTSPIANAGGEKEDEEESSDHVIPISEFERATAGLQSSFPGRSIWDVFLKRMWHLDCFDALEEFFAHLSRILVKTREERIRDRDNGVVDDRPGSMRVARESPLGTFVRRAQLEYTRIRFDGAVQLWRALIRYRMPTYHAWAKRNPSESQVNVDANLVDLGLDMSSDLSQAVYGATTQSDDTKMGMSAKDIDRLLEFQVSEMQTRGCRVSDGMKAKLERMIASGATVAARLHFIKFLDSWKAGDYPSSFDNLHRYFDYSVQSRDRTYYQYALVNLALLHADFGSPTEAVYAIREAISIARETHDMSCLNYCMSWLYHFGAAFPDGVREIQKTGMMVGEKEGLAFLQTKARETEMWSLLSSSLLSEAKLELMRGESLASVFEHIAQASAVNVKKNVCNMRGYQLMAQSGTFGRLGIAHLARSSYEIFDECYSGQSSFEDQLGIACSRSLMLSTHGNHDDAVLQLNSISLDILHNLKNQQRWVFTMGSIKLRRLLHRNDKAAAEHLISQLEACLPADSDSRTMLSLSKVELHMKWGDYDAALKLIERLAQSTPQETFDVGIQIRLLTLKARTFAKTDQAERGFSLAMRAANIAHRSRVLTGLWEAVGALSVVLMEFQEFEPARAMLESIMPQVAESEDCDLVAASYSLLVDANMGMAGQTRHEPVRQKEYLARAVEFIDCAFAEYSKVEDSQGQCEMMAKRATVMHLTGDLALANDYAAKYLDLKRQAAAER